MKPKISLVAQIDIIDDCNWAIWECEYSLDGGMTWQSGEVQSDGFITAEETLRNENGYSAYEI